jgi:hypothetical protein
VDADFVQVLFSSFADVLELLELAHVFFLDTKVVPRGRIELPTRGFSILCSTTELPRHAGLLREQLGAGISLLIFAFSAMKKHLALSGKSFYTPLAFDLIKQWLNEKQFRMSGSAR